MTDIWSLPLKKIDFPYEQQSAKYQQLNYINITNDEFSLKINSATPRLVLFNDHFSPDWEASFNGKKLSIFVTNNLFMGVVLPPGSGNLIFSFKPKLFWICVKISLFTFALFVISIFVYLLMLLQKNLKMKPKILVDTSA